ncbi:CHAP domain-containing protein [Xanthobacteraceae bacterium Astr-EGSB]|uniref:CHAP domain-containing protein n=1 Tax=Astrobacterium formosum TaxID=3069710 RepID=UPI0027B851A3|nr:CHAP domain-containing protein [Xanthobacteraceae bacterium Astr-EGSB]
MPFKTIRDTLLFKEPSRNADILQPLEDKTELDSVKPAAGESTTATVDNEAWIKVIFTPPAGLSAKGWVLAAHCKEVGEVSRPELNIPGFVSSALLIEHDFNVIEANAPFFASADFVIARAVIETGPANAGAKIPGSDAVGPLQVSSDEWAAFLKKAGTFAKDFKPENAEAHRNDLQVQIYPATFRMSDDARAISEIKEKQGVGSKADPFLPSYLDVFHAYLTNSAQAAVAISDAEASDAGKAKPIGELLKLKGELNDDQLKVVFDGRERLKGKIAATQTVAEFAAATESVLADALKKAFELIKEHCPEELPVAKQGEAPWFDIAQEEEKKNIDEHDPKFKDTILDYFKSTDLGRPNDILPWCGAFAAFCMDKSQSPVPPGAAAAKNWNSWGQGLPAATTDIPPGAVIVLSPSEGTGTTGHVGFFVRFADGGKKVELLGGNQGDKLKRTPFSASKVAAIRWIDLAPSTSASQFGAEISSTNISQQAFDLIVEFEVSSRALYEKKYRGAIWPAFESGVTIGIGYDVGYATGALLRADWDGVIPSTMISALVPAIGVKGAAAKSLALSLKGTIDIPYDAAIKVHAGRVIPRWVKVVETNLDNTSLLSPDSLGALVSLTYNRGPSFKKAGDRYSEMRDIRSCMASKQFGEIPGLIRRMSRLWPSTSGLPGRREREAEMFERGLATS